MTPKSLSPGRKASPPSGSGAWTPRLFYTTHHKQLHKSVFFQTPGTWLKGEVGQTTWKSNGLQDFLISCSWQPLIQVSIPFLPPQKELIVPYCPTFNHFVYTYPPSRWEVCEDRGHASSFVLLAQNCRQTWGEFNKPYLSVPDQRMETEDTLKSSTCSSRD